MLHMYKYYHKVHGVANAEPQNGGSVRVLEVSDGGVVAIIE